MNTFSRRSFLKGILSTAIALQVPIELIEQAGKAIDTLPDTLITIKNPTCYLKINDLLVPVNYVEVSRLSPNIEPIFTSTGRGKYEVRGYSSWIDSKDIDLSFSTNKDYFNRYRNEKIKFEIVSDKIPFGIIGNGYFSSYDVKIITDQEAISFPYLYSITGQLDNARY